MRRSANIPALQLGPERGIAACALPLQGKEGGGRLTGALPWADSLCPDGACKDSWPTRRPRSQGKPSNYFNFFNNTLECRPLVS